MIYRASVDIDAATDGHASANSCNLHALGVDDDQRFGILLFITEQGGGERRKANTIKTTDILRLKQQRSFFPIFFGDQNKREKI